jgi:hypothetical protein
MRTGFGISAKGFVTFNDNFNDENLDGCDQLVQNDARIFVYHNNETADYTYEFFDGDCPRTSDFDSDTNCLVIQWHDNTVVAASVLYAEKTLFPDQLRESRNVEQVETVLYNRWVIIFSNGEIRTEIESNNVILNFFDNRLGITSDDPSVGLNVCIPAGQEYLSSNPCIESDTFWFCRDTPVLDVDEYIISSTDTDATQFTDGNYRFGIDHLFVSDLDYTLNLASGNTLVSMSADTTNLDLSIDVSVAAADSASADTVVINESFYTLPTTLSVTTVLVDDSASTQNTQIVSSSIFGNVWILVISFAEPVEFDPTIDLLTVNGKLRSFKVTPLSGSGSNKRDVESVEAFGSIFELVIEPICDGLVTATIPAGATVPFNDGVSAQIVTSSCLLSAFAQTLNV